MKTKVRNSDISFSFSERIGKFTMWFRGLKIGSIFQSYGRWKYASNYLLPDKDYDAIKKKISHLNKRDGYVQNT